MTARYRWIIDKDRIGDGIDNGTQGPRNLDPTITEPMSRFSLYDDDNECYYEGRIFGDFIGFEPQDDFGAPNAGAVNTKIDGEWL
jgi:hypothetical protein